MCDNSEQTCCSFPFQLLGVTPLLGTPSALDISGTIPEQHCIV
jgi:hypothetical protein